MIIKNQNQQQQANYCITYGQLNLIKDTRTILIHLVSWMRQYFQSIIMSLTNLEAIRSRLYDVPLEIYHTFLPFFGSIVAERFLNLLTIQISILGILAEAIKNGDQEAVNTNTVRLYGNANELAEFLSQINPYWNQTQWQILINQFLRMSIDQMVAIASGNYDRDVEIYDRLERHTYIIADYVSSGIIQYFLP